MPDLVRSHFATQSSITIGSRWTKGGSAPGLSFKRKILSRVSAKMLHLVGVPSSVKDPTTSFRVYRRSSIESSFKNVTDINGDAILGGRIAGSNSEGAKISEVPIQFRPRWAGESKMKLARIVETAAQLLSIRTRVKKVKAQTK